MIISLSKTEHQDKEKNPDFATNLTLEQISTTVKNAMTLDNLGQFEEAISWYDKALEIDPENAVVLSYKGIILTNLGRYEEAIFWFDKAIAADPTNISALYERRLAMEKMGKHYGVVPMSQKQLF